MMIYANGQDIKRFVLATIGKTIDDKQVITFETEPEGYLKAFVSFLEHNNANIDDVKRIFVVIGPGSATALRSSIAIFNTLGFAKGIELVGIEKAKDEQDICTIKKIIESGLSSYSPVHVLAPVYEHEARITISTKDALRRQLKKDTI